MVKALLEELDMVFARRKCIRLGSEFIPKFSYQDQLLLRREAF